MTRSADFQESPETAELLNRLPAHRSRPLVSAKELRNVVEVFRNLPRLEYPINSAGELIEKIGGPSFVLDVYGIPVAAARVIGAMPAHYFPIASVENFVEKMAEVMRRNRRGINLSRTLGRIRKHLPTLRFPMDSVEDLLRAFDSVESVPATVPGLPSGHPPRVSGDQIRHWIRRHMRAELFPIRSEEEFYSKAMPLIRAPRH